MNHLSRNHFRDGLYAEADGVDSPVCGKADWGRLVSDHHVNGCWDCAAITNTDLTV